MLSKEAERNGSPGLGRRGEASVLWTLMAATEEAMTVMDKETSLEKCSIEMTA